MLQNLWHHFWKSIERNWWFCLVQIKSVIFECFLVVGSQIWRLHVGMSINCHTNNNKTHYKAAPPTGRALKTSENWKTAIFRELQFDWIFYVHALAWQVYCLLCAFFLFYSAWITAFFFLRDFHMSSDVPFLLVWRVTLLHPLSKNKPAQTKIVLFIILYVFFVSDCDDSLTA